MSKTNAVTPLRQQYLSIKANHPDAILFFRLGDFYEMFDQDAELAARELDLVLTSRPVSKSERVPMAGVPHTAVDTYVARLIEKGYTVAVCDQMSEPSGKGLVEREVTRVLSPQPTITFADLPAAQQGFMTALAAGEPVKKNAATRAALRRLNLITPDDDWAAIRLTESGRGLLPQSTATQPVIAASPLDLVQDDGSDLAMEWGTDVQRGLFGDHRPMPLKQLRLFA